MGTKKGFTLIELLVVISIIALLLSILMPALGRARRMAQQTVCKTSLKQQGVAFMGYAQDNKDSLNEGKDGWSKTRPPSHASGFGYWWADLMPYRGTDIKTLVCAAVPKRNPNYPGSGPESFMRTWTGWKNHSAVWPYAMPGLPSKGGYLVEPIPVSYTQSAWATNPADDSDISDGSVWGWMKTPPENFWRKISSVSTPSKVPIFGDGRWLEAYPNSSPDDALVAPKTEILAERGTNGLYDWGIGQFCVPRHVSGTDLLFADYSVRNVDLPELWTLRWHRQFDTNNRFAKDPSRLRDWVRK